MIESNQKQILNCVEQLAQRAQDLEEIDISCVLYCVCGALESYATFNDKRPLEEMAKFCYDFSMRQLAKKVDPETFSSMLNELSSMSDDDFKALKEKLEKKMDDEGTSV